MKNLFIAICFLCLPCSFPFASAQAPAESAPRPIHSMSEVTSFFSVAYPDATTFILNLAASWGATSNGEFVTVGEDNKVFKMTNLGWYPFGLQNQINWLLNRTYLHMDIYAPEGGSLQLGFQYYGHAGTNEAREIYGPEISNLPAGEWYSVDLPTALYTDQGYNRNTVNVLRFRGDLPEVYISNMYTFNGTPQNPYPFQDPGATNPGNGPNPEKYVFGVLQNTPGHLVSNYNAGMRMAILALGWDSFYSSEGIKNTGYINTQKALLQSYRDLGYQVMLDFGTQYAPGWIYNYPNSRWKNQYGDEYSGGIGETAVNVVFNDLMRQKQEQYVHDVFDELGKDFEIVRLGFMRYGELGFIEPNYKSKTNCYWAFDAIAQGQVAGLPEGVPVCPVPGWIPGTASANNADARQFIEWYIQSLKNYHDWQITTVRKYFDNEMAMLYPSWGLRDGQLEAAIGVNLNGSTDPEKNMEVQRAHDFRRFIEGITDPKVIVYGTWIDSNPEWSSASNPCPIEFLATAAKNNPLKLKVMGENTGGGGIAEMELTFKRMADNDLAGIMWAFENDLYDSTSPTLTNYARLIAQYLEKPLPAARPLIVKPLYVTDKNTETDWGGLNAPNEEHYVMTPIGGTDNSFKCTIPLKKFFKNNKWDVKWGDTPKPEGEAQNEGWSSAYQFAVVYQDNYGTNRTDNNPNAIERGSFSLDSDTTVTFYAVIQADERIRAFCDAQPATFGFQEAATSSLIVPPAIGQAQSRAAVVIETNGTNKKIESMTTANLLNPDGKNGNSKQAIYSRGKHILVIDFQMLAYSFNKAIDQLKNPKIQINPQPAVAVPATTTNAGVFSLVNPLLLIASIDGVSATTSPFNVTKITAALYYKIIAEGETDAAEMKLPLPTLFEGDQIGATWKNAEALNVSETLADGNYTLKFRYETVCLGDTLVLDNDGNGYEIIFTVDRGGGTGIVPFQTGTRIWVENGVIRATFAGQAQVKLYSVTGQLINQTPADGDYTHAVGRGVYLLSIKGKTYKVVVK